MSEANGPAVLNALGGQPAPEPVVAGWKRFLGMPTRARQEFVELLTRSVVEADESELVRAVEGFAGESGVARDDVVGALQACQFLLHRAAAIDLNPERFAEDLQALSPDSEAGALRLVGTRYGPLKERIREELFLQSLADHGKVLVDLDWRMDSVKASDRAVGLEGPVVFLTLRMRDADGVERTTVQLTPPAIRKLRSFVQRFSDAG